MKPKVGWHAFTHARRVYDEDTLPWIDVLRQRAAAKQVALDYRAPSASFFVARLIRLRRLRAAIVRTDENRWVSTMIDRAIYSTYRDCVRLGASGVANDILNRDAKALTMATRR